MVTTVDTSNAIDPRILSNLPGGDTIVDLGCGSGALLDQVSGRYITAIGIDAFTARLQQRDASDHKWKFMLADLNKEFPLRANSADAVVANQVIEHIAQPEFFAAEIYRILRPRGKAIITTPNIRYIKHLWKIAVNGQGPRTANNDTIDGQWDDGHIHYFTHNDIRQAFRKAGFSGIRSSALIDLKRRPSLLRSVLDAFSSRFLVREFFSGNIILIATK